MNENKIEVAAVMEASLVGGERHLDNAGQILQLLEQQGRVTLRVRGSSMLPWIKPGDVAIIRRADIENVRCGDVVLFKHESRLFVHRLVEKQGTLREVRFLAKGDAHPDPDGIVDRDLVLGRLVRIYRGNRQIDLDSPIQLALGLIVSQLSRKSAYWYPVARVAAVTAQSVWRLFSFPRSPENVPE